MTVTLADLTPTVEIIFKKLAASVVEMKEKGKVLYITQDEDITGTHTITNYTSAVGITGETDTIKQDITDLFDGGVKKVILVKTKTNMDDIADVLSRIKFDWAFTDITTDQSTLANLCVELEKFGCVYNTVKDSMYIVNFTTPSATLASDGTTVSDVRLLPYAVGIMAGCPYTKSILYKEISKYSDVTMPATLAEGTCFYRYDEDLETVKFANGNNAMTTVGEDQTDDMKKIAIVEGMVRLKSDIKYAFKKSYQGKYKNFLQTQQLFYDACKYGYYRELEKNRILDPNFANTLTTDVEEQRAMWLANGTTAAQDWDDDTVAKMTFGTYVIPIANVKFLDAIEDLKMTVKMV